jgi:hypothetical protein
VSYFIRLSFDIVHTPDLQNIQYNSIVFNQSTISAPIISFLC